MLFRKSLSSRLTSEYEYFACKHLYNWNSPTCSFGVWHDHLFDLHTHFAGAASTERSQSTGTRLQSRLFQYLPRLFEFWALKEAAASFWTFLHLRTNNWRKKLLNNNFDLKKVSFFKQTKNCRWKRKLSSSLIFSFVIYFSAVNLNKF